MDSYLIDEIWKLYVCGNNLDCFGFEVEEGIFWIKGYDGFMLECDKCGLEMQFKIGCFGKYFGCMSDICKNICKLLKNGELVLFKMDLVLMLELKCQKVDDIYVLCDGVFGLFLVVSKFLKNWEIWLLLVKEIKLYCEEIDFKYEFLMKVLEIDLEGNLMVIWYSCKFKEQYVMLEKDGKVIGWLVWYVKGKW